MARRAVTIEGLPSRRATPSPGRPWFARCRSLGARPATEPAALDAVASCGKAALCIPAAPRAWKTHSPRLSPSCCGATGQTGASAAASARPKPTPGSKPHPGPSASRTGHQVAGVVRAVPRDYYVAHTRLGTVPQATAQAAIERDLRRADVRPGQAVLEIGTGTGLTGALLAELAGPSGHVVSVDIDPALTRRAGELHAERRVRNITLVTGDGNKGAAGHGPRRLNPCRDPPGMAGPGQAGSADLHPGLLRRDRQMQRARVRHRNRRSHPGRHHGHWKCSASRATARRGSSLLTRPGPAIVAGLSCLLRGP
jgi:hypothetical protein